MAKNLFQQFGAISIFSLFVFSVSAPTYADISNAEALAYLQSDPAAMILLGVGIGSQIKQQEVDNAATAAATLRAQGDGCDDEDNDRIIAELALCSTHVYNIGLTKNPESASDKQLMKDAVALKTTVMTQQMNKQYEYLESMMKRFKTQLEKAVLTTKLQTVGATSGNGASGNGTSGGSSGGSYSGSSGSSSGGGTSTARRETNVFIENAQNCAYVLDINKKLDCLESNFAEINAEANSRITSNVRKQLATDFKILIDTNILKAPEKKTDNDNRYQFSNPRSCEKIATNNTNVFKDCLKAHANNISNAKRQLSLEDRQSAYPGYYR